MNSSEDLSSGDNKNARRTHRFCLLAYVVTPDYVHMIVFPPDDNYDVSKILKSIKQSVSRKAISYLERQCKLPCQEDNSKVESSALEKMVRYIRNIPVHPRIGR